MPNGNEMATPAAPTNRNYLARAHNKSDLVICGQNKKTASCVIGKGKCSTWELHFGNLLNEWKWEKFAMFFEFAMRR